MKFKDFTYINNVTKEQIRISTKNPVFVLNNITGVDGPGSSISTVKNVLQDGETFKSTTLNLRQITIELTVVDTTCNPQNMQEYKELLYRIFNPKHSGTLIHNLTGYQLENIWVENAPQFNYSDGLHKFRLACNIYLKAPNPYWVNSKRTLIDMSSYNKRLQFDKTIPELVMGNQNSNLIYIKNNMLTPIFKLYSLLAGNEIESGHTTDGTYYVNAYWRNIKDLKEQTLSVSGIQYPYTAAFVYNNLLYIKNKLEECMSEIFYELPSSEATINDAAEKLLNNVEQSIYAYISSLIDVMPYYTDSQINSALSTLYLLAVNGYTTTSTIVFNDNDLYIKTTGTSDGNSINPYQLFNTIEARYEQLVADNGGSQDVNYDYSDIQGESLGEKTNSSTNNIYNDGHLEAEYTIIMKAVGDTVQNPQVTFDFDNSFVKINKTLADGEEIRISITDNNVSVISSVNGNNINYLDVNSNLNLLNVGDNYVTISSGTHLVNLDVQFEFRTRRFGI